MFFLGYIYDPETSISEEYTSFSQFVSDVQTAAIMSIDDSKPPREEDTYLWIKIIVADTEDELQQLDTPFFRINKILEVVTITNGTKSKPGTINFDLIEDDDLKRIYPKRRTGHLYITAIAESADFFNNDSDEMDESDYHGPDFDEIIEFPDEMIPYPKDPSYNCHLSGSALKASLAKFQNIFDSEDFDSINNVHYYRDHIVRISFFTAEAVRFNLIQFACMNILNLDKETAPTLSGNYDKTSVWQPMLTNWSATCKKMDVLGQRGFNPKIFLNIPTHVTNRAFKDAANLVSNKPINIFGLFSSSETNKMDAQDMVLKDYSENDMEEYFFNQANFPQLEEVDTDNSIKFKLLTSHKLNNTIELAKESKQLKDYEQLIEHWQQALTLMDLHGHDADKTIQAHYEMGVSYMKLSNNNDAIEHLKMAAAMSNGIYGKANKITFAVVAALQKCEQELEANLAMGFNC